MVLERQQFCTDYKLEKLSQLYQVRPDVTLLTCIYWSLWNLLVNITYAHRGLKTRVTLYSPVGQLCTNSMDDKSHDSIALLMFLSFCFAAIGFNVETVTYKNLKFQVWDLGGQTSIRWVYVLFRLLPYSPIKHLFRYRRFFCRNTIHSKGNGQW